ncbi:ABC transporter substrate-binding protein [Dolosicoccus paucivorans]
MKLEVFRNANDRDTAFQAQQVDGMNSDLIAFAAYLEGGMDIQITGSTFGEFDLVVNDDDVQELADLKDKKVAVLTESGTHYAAVQMLKEQNIEEGVVQFEHIPPVPSRVELLRSHEVSGAILPEPFLMMSKVV